MPCVSPLTMKELNALPEDEQRAFWAKMLCGWQESYEASLDDDFKSDRDRARIDREWCA